MSLVSQEEKEWAQKFKKNDEVITFIRKKEGIKGVVLSVKKKRKVLGESYEITVHSEDSYEDTIYWQNGNGKSLIKKLNEPKSHNFF